MATENVTFIDEIVVKNRHDPVADFVENVLSKKGTPPAPDNTPANEAPTHSRYALPKTDEEVQAARQASVPEATRKDTNWCLKAWKDWSVNRNGYNIDRRSPEDPTELVSDPQQLSYWLERFVLEIRMKNGSEYNPNSLHHLVCGILRHIRVANLAIDFFKDPDFARFRMTLDSEMKRLRKLGKGSVKKQAEPIKVTEEEELWSRGVLGDHSPQALLNTVFYMNGLFFALRSGDEHRRLRLIPPQITIHDNGDDGRYLLYVEDSSKNHQGGLKQRKVIPKRVKHFANTENPGRCFVRIFELYLSRLPKDAPNNSFYLKPLIKYSQSPEAVWFSKQPIGHNKLNKMMSSICSLGGIKGFKTNHSLRATSATRLYQQGVDEQLIMERTGHRSIEGVRSYKHTNDDQERSVSNILQTVSTTNTTTTNNSIELNNHHFSQIPQLLQLQNCTGTSITINVNTAST